MKRREVTLIKYKKFDTQSLSMVIIFYYKKDYSRKFFISPSLCVMSCPSESDSVNQASSLFWLQNQKIIRLIEKNFV